jgi:hypothetical protein
MLLMKRKIYSRLRFVCYTYYFDERMNRLYSTCHFDWKEVALHIIEQYSNSLANRAVTNLKSLRQ